MNIDDKIYLKNYFEGQIHDLDEIPAVPPTFKKKIIKNINALWKNLLKNKKKIF